MADEKDINKKVDGEASSPSAEELHSDTLSSPQSIPPNLPRGSREDVNVNRTRLNVNRPRQRADEPVAKPLQRSVPAPVLPPTPPSTLDRTVPKKPSPARAEQIEPADKLTDTRPPLPDPPHRDAKEKSKEELGRRLRKNLRSLPSNPPMNLRGTSNLNVESNKGSIPPRIDIEDAIRKADDKKSEEGMHPKASPPPHKPHLPHVKNEAAGARPTGKTEDVRKPTELEKAIKGIHTNVPRHSQGGAVPPHKNRPPEQDIVRSPLIPNLAPKKGTPPPTPFPDREQPIPRIPLVSAMPIQKTAHKDVLPDEREVKRSNLSIVRPLRTYKTDVDDAMRGQKVSLAGIVSAREDRKFSLKKADSGKTKSSNQSPTKSKKRLSRTISALLILAGIALIAYFYFAFRGTEIPAGGEITSFIFVDDLKTINTDGLDADSFAQELNDVTNANTLPLGGVTHIYMTKGSGEDVLSIEADEFLELAGTDPPSTLNRSLISVFMFGTHVTGEVEPFVIFQTGFYENVFAGMLEWENSMVTDLEAVLGYDARFRFGLQEDDVVALQLPNFKDLIIQNKDARVVEDPDGEIVLLYSFLNRQTVVITTNETTLNEVARRITTTRTNE